MSTVLSCNADHFKILICDTRVTTFNNYREKIYNDDNLKVHYIENYGFFSGVGIGQLVSRTFNLFLEQRVKNANTLHEAFRGAYESIHDDEGQEVCELRDRSVVIVASKEGINACSHSFQTYRENAMFASLKRNQINIQYPYDILNEQREIIESSLHMMNAWTIEQVLLTMLEAFKCISTISDEVSSICSIAILGDITNDPYFVQGEVTSVIEDINNKTFYGLENQFEKYKGQLLSWEVI